MSSVTYHKFPMKMDRFFPPNSWENTYPLVKGGNKFPVSFDDVPAETKPSWLARGSGTSQPCLTTEGYPY